MESTDVGDGPRAVPRLAIGTAPVAISHVIDDRQIPDLLSIFTACPTKTEVEPPLHLTIRCNPPAQNTEFC